MRQRKKIIWNTGEAPAISQLPFQPALPDDFIQNQYEIYEKNEPTKEDLNQFFSTETAKLGQIFCLASSYIVSKNYTTHRALPPHDYIVSSEMFDPFYISRHMSDVIPSGTICTYLGECRVEEQAKRSRSTIRVIRHKFLFGSKIYIIQDLKRVKNL